jgi:hypothetical protein
MGVRSAPEDVGTPSACRAWARPMSSCVSETTMRLMTALSSRGRFVPTGVWPTAVAERLWVGCDLLEPPCWRGLSFARRRESPCVLDEAVRCEVVLGGAEGPPAAVVGVLLFMAGDCWARGVFRLGLCEAVWGVVGVLGAVPLLGRRE